MLLRGIFAKANNSLNSYRHVVMLFIFVGFFCNFDTTLFSVAPTGHATEWQLGFQAPASPIAEGIIAFHDDLMVFLTLVFFFVVYLLSICMHYFKSEVKKGETERLVHASTLEIIWTLIPALILVIIAIPSFSLLYSVDEIVEPLLTVKIIGHQWYWSYEFLNAEALSEILNLENPGLQISIPAAGFDSYMLSDEDVYKGEGLSSYRLLTVDNHLVLPVEVPVRLLITSSDVLHSWAVPSLGVKVDACPGRLNQASLYIKREGLYYGQCSELCGVNHGFMPIGIVGTDLGLPTAELQKLMPTLETVLVALQGIAME